MKKNAQILSGLCFVLLVVFLYFIIGISVILAFLLEFYNKGIF